MRTRGHYPEAFMKMRVEVEIETNPTPKQEQDWKDLYTWLLRPRPEPDRPLDAGTGL
jgi:hypothetical protein